MRNSLQPSYLSKRKPINCTLQFVCLCIQTIAPQLISNAIAFCISLIIMRSHFYFTYSIIILCARATIYFTTVFTLDNTARTEINFRANK
jgi:hypothetical protein